MEKHLAIDLVRSAHSNRLRIIHAVINQAGPDTLQQGAAGRVGKGDHRLDLLFRSPRYFIGRFPRADCGEPRQERLDLVALGAPSLQMGLHQLVLTAGNGVPDVISPLSDIEMANSFSHKVTFPRLEQSRGNTASGSMFPFLAVD